MAANPRDAAQDKGVAALDAVKRPRSKLLYGLERLRTKPNAQVIFVSTDRAADAGEKLFVDMCVLAWFGSKQCDFSAFKYKKVVLIPSANIESRAQMQWLEGQLLALQCTVKVAEPEDDRPHAWSIADESWTGEQAVEWARERIAQRGQPINVAAPAVEVESSPPDPEPPVAVTPYNVVSLADHVNDIPPGDGPPEDDSDPPPAFSEDALAAQFTRKYGDDWRYVAEWGCWFQWDGKGWRRDETLLMPDQIRELCRFAVHWDLAKALSPQAQRSLTSAKAYRAIESIAKSDREHALRADVFDQDLWLLGTPEGVVDLKTGLSRPAERTDYLTKRTAVSPGGDCPKWREFLQQVTNDDDNMQAYLQRLAGYCLTGTFSEQMFAFLYGHGGNGKGVFIRQLIGLMGDYATTASMDTFTESRAQRHETEFARLHGMRLVSAQETEEGRRWAQAKIQELTGGDKITTRFMHKDHFTFQPQFKLIFVGNHKPSLRSVNDAIKRRCHLVPFMRTIKVEDQDIDLDAKLKAEWPGILQWAIDGCLFFQRERLMPPASIMEATKDYLQSEDMLLQWIDECCDADESFRVKSANLYKSYQSWCDQQGERANSAKRFIANLREKNYKVAKVTGYNTVFGLKLKQADEYVGGPPLWHTDN